MNQFPWGLVLLLSSLNAWAKLSPEQVAQLPPPADHPIRFSAEIKPIFEASCIKCHGRGRDKGGFTLDSRESLLKGGDSGPVVVQGKSSESYLVELVSGIDPDNVMPQKGKKLSPEQVGLLRAWIDQGMPWDEGVSFGRSAPLNLKPPETPLPAGPAAIRSVNGIDLLLKRYYQQHQATPPEPVEDRLFARRAYLDLVGLLPSPAELERFLADDRPLKREYLVRELLADRQRYAGHWLTFWNDLLRNDYKGTGYIDEGRKQITEWLYSALVQNMPFDQFVAELINPNADSEGFVKGIVWRGVVNASQTPQMQAAQNISQVFMGVNLKCASCHDSFINDWTLADAYGLASVYADNALEMVHCDKPTGKTAPMKFLYPELGSFDPGLSKKERLRRLSELVTQKQNGRLARTIVNRLWARLMGRGLVEPVDDMEQPAWSPELLDWLAADLVANGYDLKKTIERIATSQAYQAVSVPATETVNAAYVFRGPWVKRFTAEQFEDALSQITGLWGELPANTQVDFSAGQPAYALSESENPARLRWIWSQGGAAAKAKPGTVWFRRRVECAEKPTHAVAVITCDNRFKLFLNGKEIGSGNDHNKPTLVDLRPHLVAGTNLLAIAAVNDSGSAEAKKQDNPAGLLCYLRIRCESERGGLPVTQVWDVGSSEAWRCSTNHVDGWEKPAFDDSAWTGAVELGMVNIEPWKLEKRFSRALSAASVQGQVRAALVAADPLMTALGRPNREQVMTTRASAATTLQALELTNGKTLSERLKEGSEHLMGCGAKNGSRGIVQELFERTLARAPRADELREAEELVGSPARKEGVEDLLWAMVMLPEFQLIY